VRLRDAGDSPPTPRADLAPVDDAWARRVSLGVERGERAALGAFYSVWFDRCFAQARRLTRRDESFCLDVVQDAMVRAAGSMRRVECERQLAVWVRRVVASCAVDRVREESSRAARQRSVSRGEQQEGRPPADRLEWLAAELAEIDAEEALLLRERLVNGGTMARAGALLGMSGPAAHGRLRRLLESLRRSGKARFHDA
jgi:DNA-directed RNA polymerase specialized sigma24 family protein